MPKRLAGLAVRFGAPHSTKYWLVTISDGTSTFEFIADTVEWPLQGDGFLVLKFDAAQAPLSFLQQLDEWEESGTELTVDAVAKCVSGIELAAGGVIPEFCTPERLDYDSFSGKAPIVDKRNCVTIEEADEQGVGLRHGHQRERDIELW